MLLGHLFGKGHLYFHFSQASTTAGFVYLYTRVCMVSKLKYAYDIIIDFLIVIFLYTQEKKREETLRQLKHSA